MKWILFFVILDGSHVQSGTLEFNELSDCQEARRDMRELRTNDGTLLRIAADCYGKKD